MTFIASQRHNLLIRYMLHRVHLLSGHLGTGDDSHGSIHRAVLWIHPLEPSPVPKYRVGQLWMNPQNCSTRYLGAGDGSNGWIHRTACTTRYLSTGDGFHCWIYRAVQHDIWDWWRLRWLNPQIYPLEPSPYQDTVLGSSVDSSIGTVPSTRIPYWAALNASIGTVTSTRIRFPLLNLQSCPARHLGLVKVEMTQSTVLPSTYIGGRYGILSNWGLLGPICRRCSHCIPYKTIVLLYLFSQLVQIFKVK
jgi:hypothetical protein